MLFFFWNCLFWSNIAILGRRERGGHGQWLKKIYWPCVIVKILGPSWTTSRDCHGLEKTGYYLWPLIPITHRLDPWIYMEIHRYLWSICYIWMIFMGAAATHQCAAALCKLVELINFTPSLSKNTLWWIWTRIYWNTIISSAFPLNIGLIIIPLYIHS